MTTRFSDKDPAEVVPVLFDFVNLSITPANPEITVVLLRGTDASPSAIISGSPTVVGTKVYQNIQGGVNGCEYGIRCEVDATTGGLRYVDTAILPVKTKRYA